jgi:hypothetical protein
MNKHLTTWLQYCRGSTKAASYYLQMTEDEFLDELSRENISNDLKSKIDDLMQLIPSSFSSETEALLSVISDMEIKIERGLLNAVEFLDSFNIQINTKEK